MSLEREVGEIHTKVDHLIALQEKQNGRVSDLEKQVGGLRRWQSMIVGGFTVLGSGVGALFTKITG